MFARRHHILLGVCLVCFMFVQWGALDMGMNLHGWSMSVKAGVAGLLSLAAFLFLMGGLLTYREIHKPMALDPPIWRWPMHTVYGCAVLAVIYPLFSGRFGMAFVGIIALAIFCLAISSRLRMLGEETGERLDASLKNVRSVVLGMELERQRDAGEIGKSGGG